MVSRIIDSTSCFHFVAHMSYLSQNPNIPKRRVATVVNAVRDKVELLARIAR